jgi:hypothetical protein
MVLLDGLDEIIDPSDRRNIAAAIGNLPVSTVRRFARLAGPSLVSHSGKSQGEVGSSRRGAAIKTKSSISNGPRICPRTSGRNGKSESSRDGKSGNAADEPFAWPGNC